MNLTKPPRPSQTPFAFHLYPCGEGLNLAAFHFRLAVATVLDVPSGSTGTLIASLELAAPFCSTVGSRIFLDLKNMITTPIIRANPSTPPTTPPIIAFLFVVFAPLVLVVAAVAEATYDPVEEDLVEVEERDVVEPGVVANFATVVVKLCPICPAKVVSAGRGT